MGGTLLSVFQVVPAKRETRKSWTFKNVLKVERVSVAMVAQEQQTRIHTVSQTQCNTSVGLFTRYLHRLSGTPLVSGGSLSVAVSCS